MAETPIAYGLTTKNRVKDRIGISDSRLDTVIDRLIGEVTDFIESMCGGRRFLRTTYTNEVYSILNSNQKMIALRNIPLISISSAQYRFGLKSDPNWTEFNTDDWEIVNDGGSGLVRVWGLVNGINSLRFSYVAGYLIDFENAGTPASHTLPMDLSGLAERLVDKRMRRRNKEGVADETYQGGSVTYKELLDEDDRQTIARYTRLPVFV